MEDKLLTRKEAAGILNVSERTLDAYRQQGLIKAVKLRGYTVRIRESELRRFLEESISEPEPDANDS